MGAAGAGLETSSWRALKFRFLRIGVVMMLEEKQTARRKNCQRLGQDDKAKLQRSVSKRAPAQPESPKCPCEYLFPPRDHFSLLLANSSLRDFHIHPTLPSVHPFTPLLRLSNPTNTSACACLYYKNRPSIDSLLRNQLVLGHPSLQLPQPSRL